MSPDYDPDTNEYQPSAGEVIIYVSEDGRSRIECRFVVNSLAKVSSWTTNG